jgi:hypothetical protein
VGAVYLRLGRQNPAFAGPSCYGETTYGVEVPGSVDVNVLSDRPQEFSVLADGTTDPNQTGEVWLSGPDVSAVDDPTVILAAAGTATKDGVAYPFTASLTISENRLIPASDTTPGTHPICKQRIVTPIPVSILPSPGGNLLLRIDPSFWFDAIDFSTIAASDGVRVIPDDAATPNGRKFFQAVTSTAAYRFSWLSP